LRTDIHPDGRHELLNDVLRDKVTDNLVGWLGEFAIRR